MDFNTIDNHFHLGNNQIAQLSVINNLLRVRFQVVALYPYSEFKIKQIISPSSKEKIELYRQFPINFRELKWSEYRKQEEMPNFLKLQNGTLVKVEEWDLKVKRPSMRIEGKSYFEWLTDNDMPIAEYEYSKAKKNE